MHPDSGFQLMFTPFGYPGFHVFGDFYLNTYTAPACFACLINLLGMVLIYTLFQEHYAGVDQVEKKEVSQ
jgi:hypothetical protein